MKQLMIVGTFHMETQNDGNNLKDTERIFSMQNEINTLIEQLSKYKPTKIFVEWEKKRQPSLDELMQNYRNGKVKSTNEIIQIAFPLATKNHCKVLGIDWMEKGAGLRGCGDVLDELCKYPSLKKEIDQYEAPITNLDDGIIENFRRINSKKEVDNSKACYINFARIGVDEYYGMGWLIWWYQRNMNIFANISDALEENDRALLLIGTAHKGLLEEFFKDSLSVEIVDSLNYL